MERGEEEGQREFTLQWMDDNYAFYVLLRFAQAQGMSSIHINTRVFNGQCCSWHHVFNCIVFVLFLILGSVYALDCSVNHFCY